MSRLPRISGKNLIAALRQSDSISATSAEATIIFASPANRDLPTGTLRAIVRQAGLTVDELSTLL